MWFDSLLGALVCVKLARLVPNMETLHFTFLQNMDVLLYGSGTLTGPDAVRVTSLSVALYGS